MIKENIENLKKEHRVKMTLEVKLPIDLEESELDSAIADLVFYKFDGELIDSRVYEELADDEDIYQKYIYSLTETYEGEDVPRETRTMATSFDSESLRVLMETLIEKDEYGFISENGVQDHAEMYFETNYKDGFLSYDISIVEII